MNDSDQNSGATAEAPQISNLLGGAIIVLLLALGGTIAIYESQRSSMAEMVSFLTPRLADCQKALEAK